MTPKGYVVVKAELVHTKRPPENYPPGADYNMAEDYFDAMRGKRLTVLDVAVNGDGYLVLAKGERSGDFIWDLDAHDCEGPMELRPDPLSAFNRIMRAMREGEE